MADGAFVSVYHEDLIRNFPDVWYDDRLLATWLRLLVLADKMWPSPADLPKGVRGREFAQLVAVGLVQELPQQCFRILGLDARRMRQQSNAQSAANARWNAGSNAGRIAASNAKAMPTRPDQTRPDTGATLRAQGMTIPVKGMDGHTTDASVQDGVQPDIERLQLLAEELTGRAYVMVNTESAIARKAIEEQLVPHRWGRTETAWRQVAQRYQGEAVGKPTLRQLVLGADDLLNPIARGLSQEAAQAEEQARYDRRVEATRQRLRALEEPA